jgi:hypothetical protein
MMRAMLAIVKRLHDLNVGNLQIKGMKQSYMGAVEGEDLLSEEGQKEWLRMRLRMRYYLRELNLYASFT